VENICADIYFKVNSFKNFLAQKMKIKKYEQFSEKMTIEKKRPLTHCKGASRSVISARNNEIREIFFRRKIPRADFIVEFEIVVEIIEVEIKQSHSERPIDGYLRLLI
jgi:hypothetical protein